MTASSDNLSIAKQLVKLAALHASGALSDDEFQKIKSELIAKELGEPRSIDAAKDIEQQEESGDLVKREQEISQKQKSTNNAAQYLILGLIVIALIGLAVFVITVWKNNNAGVSFSEHTELPQVSDDQAQEAAAPVESVKGRPESAEEINKAQEEHDHPNLSPSPYHFTITVTGGANPVISGTSDIPNGGWIMFSIASPWLPDAQERLAQGLSACGNKCEFATSLSMDAYGTSNSPCRGNSSYDCVVQRMGGFLKVDNGHFSAGPFSFSGSPFAPGVYIAKISYLGLSMADEIKSNGPIYAFRFGVKPSGDVVYISEPASAGQGESAERQPIINNEVSNVEKNDETAAPPLEKRQKRGMWYYCDPAKAYYPYVSRCPVPWRAVAPNTDSSAQTNSPQPQVTTPPTQWTPNL